MSWQERAADLGYAAGWRLVRTLPASWATWFFNRGADLAARRGGGPAQLRKNLARVIGVATPAEVPAELVQASMRSYARYWRESFRLPSIDLEEVARMLDAGAHGLDNLDRAAALGKGVILALPHSGNWDMTGVWLTRRRGSFATVAERLKPESLFLRFVEYRESLGFTIFPLTGGETPPFAALTEILRGGGFVCLLGERDLRARGVEVEFFGETTRFPAGPVKLAQDTGAQLLPVHAWFEGEGWGYSVAPPVDVSQGLTAATQALADSFAANIKAHPEDWHMLQPLWLDDLSDSHRAHLGEKGAEG